MNRSTKSLLNLIITIILMLGISALLMTMSYNYKKQFDQTADKKFTLAEQTLKILQSLPADVEAIVFYARNSDFQKQAEDLLNQYKYKSKRFSVRSLETNKHPLEFREYNLQSLNAIVLKSGNKREMVTTPNEEAVTNALIKVIQAGSKTVYFVTGHGERQIEDEQFDQMKAAADALKKEAYDVKSVNLTQSGSIPADANVLVLAGPRTDYGEGEIKMMADFLDKGGAMLAMFDIGADMPNLAKFFEERGLQANSDLILDALGKSFAGSPAYALAAMPVSYGNHPIVKDFRLTTIFPRARSLSLLNKPESKFRWETVVSTTNQAWSRPISAVKGRINENFDPKTDKRGPLVIAAASSLPITAAAPSPTPTQAGSIPEPKRNESRIVVFANSVFASNQFFGQWGNNNLFLNSISWLAEQESLISIRPKTGAFVPLNMSEQDRGRLLILTVFLIPALMLIIGIMVYINKRL